MRKIATPENMEKARGELISEHKDVTVEGIRQRIGGGSYNTILTCLRGSAEKEACGLAQLPALFNRATFSKCMGRRFASDEDLICMGMADHLVGKGILKRS